MMMLARALRYAEKGWPVLPIARDGKLPLVASRHGKDDPCRGECGAHGHGVYDATTDETTIRNWWGDDGEPAANIGLRAGIRWWVLDIDAKLPAARKGMPPGITGYQMMAILEEKHGPLPPTLTVRTPGGGEHRYFALPRDRVVGNRAKIKAPDGRASSLDCRGAGGYVLGEPSVVGGKSYALHARAGIVAAPAWLLDVVAPPRAEPRTPAKSPLVDTSAAGTRYGAVALSAACRSIAEAGQGQRHDAILHAALKLGSLVAGGAVGLSSAACEEALVSAAVASGKDQREVVRTVRDGLRHGANNPRVPEPRERRDWRSTATATRGGNAAVAVEDDPEMATAPGMFTDDAEAPPHTDDDAPRRPAPLAPPGSTEEQHAPDVEAARAAIVAILDHLRAEPQRKDAAAALLSSARGALAWLATFYPAEWRAAHADIASCPRAKSLADLHDRSIRELAKSRRDEAIPARKAMAATGITLDGADADPGLSMPVPYVLDDGGVWRHERDGSISQVCRAPIFVASVGESADGSRTVLLRYRLGGRWLTADVPRTAASVGRELAALGGQGLPVSSASAAGLVAYFEAFLVHNAAVLRVENVRASLGWIEGGDTRAFLWGTTVIGSADARPSSALADQFPVIAGYRAAGTMVGWRRAYDLVREMEAFQLALLVACAPPFIRLVPGAPNPIMDFAGATSEGKTTALRFAASAWGLPDDRDAHGILRTWDVTPTWLERAAAATSDLPLVLDDSKRQDKPEVVRGVVYAIAQGQGRGRGTVTGVQVTATWHTALISSGENPLVAHLKGHGGAQARVITSLGSPLGGKSQENARVARDLRATVLEHHGHAGPAVVRWLIDDANLARARAAYAAALEAWSARAGDDAIAARRAETFALLSTVAETLRDLGIGTEERHLLAAWGRARMDTGADVAVAAMMATWEWAVTRQAAIYGRHDAGRPPARFDGRAERGDPWAVALAPGALREHLAHLGFEPEAVIAQWADRDWLLRGDGNNATRKARVNGAPVRLYCVTTAALREAGCIAADAEPWTWTETDERKPPSWLDNADR